MLDLSMRNPSVIYDLTNPARSLVTDATLDFGITIPYYNGQEAFRTGGRFGGGGQVPVLSTPKMSKQEVQNLPPGYSWLGKMNETAKHEIEWQIHLIPRPQNASYWESLAREGSRLWSFIDSLYMRDSTSVDRDYRKWLTDVAYKRRFQLPGTWKVKVFPLPSVEVFMSHLLAHEYQHVEDHAWLTYEIFGPLNEWQENNNMSSFVASSKFSFEAIGIAGTAETQNRLMDYWQRALEESGNLYHASQAGAHPVVKVRRITRENDVRSIGEIDFTIEPARTLRYTGFDLDDPRPHGFSQNKVFNVATGRLGGNEPKLDYRHAAQYNSRIVNFGTTIVHNGMNYLALDDPEASDYGTFGSLFDSKK